MTGNPGVSGSGEPTPPSRFLPDDDPITQDDAPPALHSPTRPTPPESGFASPSRPRLVPARPSATPLDEAEKAARPAAEAVALNPQQALDRLRRKMTRVAEEFAAGQINRAQFHAIYSRYSEQRRIIERMLARDPASQAWQQVARPGHTSFLRHHFEARVLFFALFALGKATSIAYHGTVIPPRAVVVPILRALPAFLRKKGALGPARKRLEDGRWLVVVPGRYAVSIVLYSLEPSAQQVGQIVDLHGDFERANHQALIHGDHAHERLVFPQRALFEA